MTQRRRNPRPSGRGGRQQHRVKWCERHGDACDSNGEWHAHWHAVRSNDDPRAKFTIVHAVRTPARTA